MISLIVAFDKNWGIGINNTLPWHIPNDLKRFKEITTNKVVVMGRKTFDSIGNPLPNRTNVIITKDSGLGGKYAGCYVFNSIKEFLEVKEMMFGVNKEYFIIGGQSIYEQFMPYAERLYVTLVHGEYETDTRFPEFTNKEWELQKGELYVNEPTTYSFLVYERKKSS